MYAPLSRFLLRAPLLPTASLARAARALTAHPLGTAAIAVASPTLAGAAAGPARARSITRYARRAAFRATPSGLLAGVCVGELGPKTEIATGRPAPHLAPSWARVDALAQALLHEPAIRDRVRLRAAPSVWTDGAVVNWVGGREELYGPCTADLDGAALALAAVLAATTDWAPWATVRARAHAAQPEAGDLDELLRALVYDGLLQSDLSPPLIGPPPASYLRDQLAALGRQSEARALDEAGAAFEAGDSRARPRPLDGASRPGRPRRHGCADPAGAKEASPRAGGCRARRAAGPAALPASGGARSAARGALCRARLE